MKNNLLLIGFIILTISSCSSTPNETTPSNTSSVISTFEEAEGEGQLAIRETLEARGMVINSEEAACFQNIDYEFNVLGAIDGDVLDSYLLECIPNVLADQISLEDSPLSDEKTRCLIAGTYSFLSENNLSVSLLVPQVAQEAVGIRNNCDSTLEEYNQFVNWFYA